MGIEDICRRRKANESVCVDIIKGVWEEIEGKLWGNLLSFAPEQKMIRCLLSKHAECFPADETLTSHTARTFFQSRERSIACVWMWNKGKVMRGINLFYSFYSLSHSCFLSPYLSLSLRLSAVFKMRHLTLVPVIAGKWKSHFIISVFLFSFLPRSLIMFFFKITYFQHQ